MRVVALVVVSACVQGCASFKAEPLAAAASLEALESRSLDDPGLHGFMARQGSPATGRWNLDRLALAALYFQPDLAAARAERNLAEAGAAQAAERANPTLAVGPGYNSTSRGISPWILTTALDFPLELPGKRALRRSGARHRLEASRWQLAATAWKTRSALRQAMLNLYAADKTLSLMREHEALQGEIVALVEAKRKAGESSPFEASQARLGLSQTRLMLDEAARQAAVARARVAAAVGIPARALAEIELDFGSFARSAPPADTAASRRRALTNRADILAALSDYAAAEADLHLEIANQYPDLNLGGGYELDQTDNKWNLGFSVELPVLNQRKGKIAEAKAKRELAAAHFLQVQGAALAEIDQAVADLGGARKKSATARRILDEVRSEATSAAKMKAAGALEKLELLQRQLELSTAQLALAEAQIAEQDSLGALEDALQVPADAELDSHAPLEFEAHP